MKKSLFWGGFAVAFVASVPMSASGAWSRHHAQTCAPGNYGSNDIAHVETNPEGFLTNEDTCSNCTQYLVCEVRDDSDYKKADISTFNVHVYDGNSSANFTARLCISYWNSSGGDCGTSSSTSGTGEQTLSPSLSKFTMGNEAHFGFLNLGIPSKGSGSYSWLKGWYSST